MIPAPFKHQEETSQFIVEHPSTFITSDPGTGKTRSVLDALTSIEGRTLVLAPKSILQPSWGEDIKTFTPNLSYAIASAPDTARKAAFKSGAKIIIMNHDGVKFLAKNPELLEGFTTLVIDESTAFKNYTSARSKACKKLSKLFERTILMTGTPNPNGIIDIWHQMAILDGGERLGDSYWKFRGATHTPISKGPFTEWVEKEGITDAIFALIEDINIRHKFEDCISIPENFITEVDFELSAKHLKAYATLKEESFLEHESGDVTALNAAVLTNKLLQAASGSVYDSDGTPLHLDSGRYELIIQLIEQRDQCVVAFNWGHQKDELVKLAVKAKMTYGIIDGSASAEDRAQVVKDFQAGKLRVIFAHPASAAHGLTLTKGTTTIWASPTYNAEHYAQFCKRIYRAGQTKRTETIHISAEGTIDAKVYKILREKTTKMSDLLELLEL